MAVDPNRPKSSQPSQIFPNLPNLPKHPKSSQSSRIFPMIIPGSTQSGQVKTCCNRPCHPTVRPPTFKCGSKCFCFLQLYLHQERTPAQAPAPCGKFYHQATYANPLTPVDSSNHVSMAMLSMEPQWARKMWTPLLNTNVWFIPGSLLIRHFVDVRNNHQIKKNKWETVTFLIM